jgi:hypothetical protein
VQRWERSAGLPVRRQPQPAPNSIIAIPEELEAWARTRTRGPSGAQAGALQRDIEALRAENGALRSRVDRLEAAMLSVAAGAGRAEPSETCLCLEQRILVRFRPSVVPESASTRSESAKTRSFAQQCRAGAVRARLGFASTLCAISEREIPQVDSRCLQRARHSATEIRRSLEQPGCVPLNELTELRALLGTLVLRIERIAHQATRDPHPLRPPRPLW